MSGTLILGAGFGGLACARALRARVAEPHRIQVVDRSAEFVVGASKSWVMLGERTRASSTRRRAELLPDGVEWIEAEVEAIAPERRAALTSAGRLEADHLVIALGADLDGSIVPGLEESLTFYTLDGADRTRDRLESFRGGRIVLLIPRTPFMCPPAPYEAAMLLHDHLVRRGLRAQSRIDVITVEPAPMATAGPEIGRMVLGELAAREIGFQPLRKTTSIDPARQEIRFETGAPEPYDLLITIPPHRVPRVVAAAGLAEPGGWIPVDPATLEVRRPGLPPHVYAIGDLTAVPLPGRFDPALPLVLPKAGVFAAAHGEVVARRIAATVRGEVADAAFDGRGFCYIEVGAGRAMRGDGSFFDLPHPRMTAQRADEARYRDKLAWVDEWLGRPARQA